MAIRKTLGKLSILTAFVVLAACSSATSNKQTTGATEPVTSAKKIIKTASARQRPSEIINPEGGKITRTGEVYLLRGLANVFSRGMDTLGRKMARQGLDARVYNHSVWKDLAANIIARSKAKRVSYPIIIMGHSLGANVTTQMANMLGRHNIPVQYIVTFDPTRTGVASRNVKRAINFYLPNEENTNVIKKGPRFRGTLKNINVRGVRGLKHTTVEKDRKFHNQVIKRTLSYTKKRRRKRG